MENGMNEQACNPDAEVLRGIQSDLSYLKDLFVRRLYDDKQKTQLIQELSNAAKFSVIEPFLKDIFLLIDRMEKTDDDTALSVVEELEEILDRRNVTRIPVGKEFNPAIHKAIRVTINNEIDHLQISGICRNGYMMGNKVIRPAEVFLEKPDPDQQKKDQLSEEA